MRKPSLSFLSKLTLTVLTLLITATLTGCSSLQDTPASSDGNGSTLTVVTSIAPIADLVKNVGGDKVTVTSLTKPGSDPHDYAPKPEDIRLVAQATVFFANGAGEEPYLPKLVNSTGSTQLKVVTLSNGLQILGKGGDNPEYNLSGNPHLWLDVHNAIAYVNTIEASLAQLSPQNKAYFAQNAKAYINQLITLDQSIRAKINSIPPANRKMVVFHDSFPYFAKQYGLANLRPIVENSETDPSAQQYADLITFIKAQHVKAVFAESGFNPKMAKQLAQDTGVKFVNNLYTDTFGTNSATDSYIKMMNTNADTIAAALK